ncbi:hypothetical protein [uncultured Clostridium sp.]|uniref:hypothetical protein n=1 Tax=uncultured Clostridium sp. TaxID=59620 RepID=UPI0025DADC74|nr:hypothetical protein [uncultured Clostridium sp.]
MKGFNIIEIKKEDLNKNYIWSNLILEEQSFLQNYFRLEFYGRPFLDFRCTSLNEYNNILEIGIIRIGKISKALREILDFLKVNSFQLCQVLVFIVSGDRLGKLFLGKAGFNITGIWRQFVKIEKQQFDVEIFSYEWEMNHEKIRC